MPSPGRTVTLTPIVESFLCNVFRTGLVLRAGRKRYSWAAGGLLLRQKRKQILIINLLLLVRQLCKPVIHIIELVYRKLIAELPVARSQRVAPGVLPEHDAVLRCSDRLGSHDLIT